MSDTKLPVKIRMGIRDSWDNPKCPLREATNALSGLLGTSVEIFVDWGMFWNILSPQYPDPTTFVPCIEEAAIVWCETLHERLDSDDLEDWTDEFLEKVKTGSGIRAEVGVSESGMGRPETTWNSGQSKLELLFPKEGGKFYRNILQPGFASDWEQLFVKKSASTTRANLPIANNPPPAEEDGWSVVPPTTAPAAVNPVANAPRVQAAQPENLPSMATLARPEVLFETSVPYFLYVRNSSKEILIEGSHNGSLKLIREYFQKWLRKDRNYNGDLVQIETQTALFGLSAGFDHVKFTCNRWETMNPTPFLAFIEIVLKYQLVESTSGAVWFFRRDVKFL